MISNKISEALDAAGLRPEVQKCKRAEVGSAKVRAGFKGSSDNNETLRFTQGDKKRVRGFEGSRVRVKEQKFKVKGPKVQGSSYKLEPTEKTEVKGRIDFS